MPEPRMRAREQRLTWCEAKIRENWSDERIREGLKQHFNVKDRQARYDVATAWERLGRPSPDGRGRRKGYKVERAREQFVMRARYDDIYAQSMKRTAPAFCGTCKDPEDRRRPAPLQCSSCGQHGVVMQPKLGLALAATKAHVELYKLDVQPEELLDDDQIAEMITEGFHEEMHKFSDDQLERIRNAIQAEIEARSTIAGASSEAIQ